LFLLFSVHLVLAYHVQCTALCQVLHNKEYTYLLTYVILYAMSCYVIVCKASLVGSYSEVQRVACTSVHRDILVLLMWPNDDLSLFVLLPQTVCGNSPSPWWIRLCRL